MTAKDRKSIEGAASSIFSASQRQSLRRRLLAWYTANQRDLLTKLVDVYVSDMTADVAAERMDRLRKAGLDKIAFAWAGELEVGKRHYYRVQGPTFLIEYDNTQNDANHIHSVWRDFNGDFGEDLLREHVRGVPHDHH